MSRPPLYPRHQAPGCGPGNPPRPDLSTSPLAQPRGVSPGPHPGGLQAHTWGVSRPTPKGVSQHALRQTPPPKPMATAVGGTHPTGMHSCVSFDLCFFYKLLRIRVTYLQVRERLLQLFIGR